MRSDAAPAVVLDELARLDPDRIVIAGGDAAVSHAVVEQVRARLGAHTVIERIGLSTRYRTAEAIVRDAFTDTQPDVAFVATGATYPDALAAGAAAGAIGSPVILLNGAKSALSEGTTGLLADLGITRVYIAGGSAAVSPGIEAGLRSALGDENVVRLAGSTRYSTAAIIADEVYDSTEFAILASGRGFADALAGGPLAAMRGAPLYLAGANCVPGVALDQIWAQNVQGIEILGGSSVLGSRVDELGSC